MTPSRPCQLAALSTLAGCFFAVPYAPVTAPPHPAFPRQCTPAQASESFDCAQFQYDLLVTPNPGEVGPGVAHEFGASIGGRDGSGHLRGGSRTECGCIQSLADKADWAADNNYTPSVVAYCHCARARD